MRHRATACAVALSATFLGVSLPAPADDAVGRARDVGQPTSVAVPATHFDGINGYRAVGYYPNEAAAWYGYTVAKLDRTGAAGDLTHINYAFGKVSSDLKCSIEAKAVTPPGSMFSEDSAISTADYTTAVSAADSVDGRADTPDQPLAGTFNQLRKLKAKHPGIKVLVSLAGYWPENLTPAGATPESRAAFVDSCLDLYIDGDLPVVGGRGGPGAAAGLFDGIDIDWEPVAFTDQDQLVALMAEFRKQLDERAPAGTHYELSAFAPASRQVAKAGGWLDPRLYAAVDFLSVSGYDFYGPSRATKPGEPPKPDLTGHQANLHQDPTHASLSADRVLAMYEQAGAPRAQLNLGLPTYGRGWSGVRDGARAWQPAQATLDAEWYWHLRTVGSEYIDRTTGAAWRWDGDQWWTLDTPASVTLKAEWLAEQGYGGAQWWHLAGDYQNQLGSALAKVLRVARPGPGVAPSCATPWYAAGLYAPGAVVAHQGVEYRARTLSHDKHPAASPRDWLPIGPCGTAGPPPSRPQCPAPWSPTVTYGIGEAVSRAGVRYITLLPTGGAVPGADPAGPWVAVGPCR